jgi:hypothetical protein
MMSTDTHALPAGFEDLEPFTAQWVLPDQRARYLARLEASMDDMQAFYDATMARIDDVLAYLEQYAVDDLGDEGRNLLWLYCALCNVSFPIEVWRQPRVPDSGAADWTPVVLPVV